VIYRAMMISIKAMLVNMEKGLVFEMCLGCKHNVEALICRK